MSTIVTNVHDLDDYPGCIALGADSHSERLPKADEWCCESCEDNRHETWGRRIKLPATIHTEATK